MRRAGGWILGFVVILAMSAGGWFVLRRLLFADTVVVVLMREPGDRQPTIDAMSRGARFALEEAGARAGRFRVRLVDTPPASSEHPWTAAWIGSSQAMMLIGEWQTAPMEVAAFDVHPWETASSLHLTPGCVRQGEAAARWAKRKDAAHVFVVQDKDHLPSETIASGFMAEAKRSGPIIFRLADSTEPDLVESILAWSPDLVFYAGEEAPYGTAHKLFSALLKKGYAGILVMGEADPGVSFLATRPSVVEGSYLVSPFSPAPPNLAGRMGFVPGPHVTAGYFAMKVVLETLELANSIDDNRLWQASARLPYFDAERRAALRPCALYVARNGKFEFVENLK